MEKVNVQRLYSAKQPRKHWVSAWCAELNPGFHLDSMSSDTTLNVKAQRVTYAPLCQ